MLKRAHVGDLTLGWYAALPYLLTIIFAPMIARRSDRVGERRLHSAMPALAGAVLLLCASSFDRHLAGTLTSMCAATLCIYTGYVVFWSIPTAYLKSHAAAGGIALINSIGLLGGFLSPSLIGWLKSATGSLEMGLFAMAALLFVGGLLILVTPAARPPQPSLIDSATAADA
jgi:nitrate/nitrite transporter NarK